MTLQTLVSLALLQQGGGSGMGVLLIQLLLFAAIFYFILIRPSRQAQKRHRETLAALKRGDRVMTEGGILAEVVHLNDDEITIRSGETRLHVLRSKIARVITAEAE